MKTLLVKRLGWGQVKKRDTPCRIRKGQEKAKAIQKEIEKERISRVQQTQKDHNDQGDLHGCMGAVVN